jgi:hypothetical protein
MYVNNRCISRSRMCDLLLTNKQLHIIVYMYIYTYFNAFYYYYWAFSTLLRMNYYLFIPFGCMLIFYLIVVEILFLFMIKLLRYSNFLLRLNRVSRIIYANHILFVYNIIIYAYYAQRHSLGIGNYIAWILGCIQE